MSLEIGANRPFPPDVEGDMSGAFCERPLRGGAASLYVIIRPRRYMTERDAELIAKGKFSIEELHPEVRRLGRQPPPDTLWLDEVESFEVAREHHENQETFNDNAGNYVAEVFDDFVRLLEYCQAKFQISERDFTRSGATNYPPS
jgi:hypothetical protein